jgi:hypothetical protein
LWILKKNWWGRRTESRRSQIVVTSKPMSETKSLIPMERIERAILLVRGEKVMLDSDLAEIYGVETKALNRAVKRNASRFPNDFMFKLTPKEAESLRCQFGTSNAGRGGRRYLPYAFTEHGADARECSEQRTGSADQRAGGSCLRAVAAVAVVQC